MTALLRGASAAALLVACSCRRDPDALQKAPVAGPEARTVSVGSRPVGADVLVGGTSRCRTPCSFRIDPGYYRLVLRIPGYMPWEADLVVRPGADAQVEADLVSSH